jgi:hypothetical protein
MFYGFDERTPLSEWGDEFAVGPGSTRPDGMGDRFRDEGVRPFNTHSGLDLGDGVGINVLFAWLGLKYARYHARLGFTVEARPARAPWAGEAVDDRRLTEVTAEGFFFDISGGYMGYSGGIAVARRDALTRAFDSAMDGATDAIDRMCARLRLTARIDGVAHDSGQDVYLLGTGPQADVAAGTRYRAVADPTLLLEVTRAVSSGAVARLVEGAPAQASPGLQLVEWRSTDTLPSPSAAPAAVARVAARAPASGDVTSSESVKLPDTNFPKAAFDPGQAPAIGEAEAFLLSLLEEIFLPYRIWRFEQTDLDFTAGLRAREGWRPSDGPVMAVLDSGVDLRHPAIEPALWRNPGPIRDGEGAVDVGGWDFISGDARPHDDHGHGTSIAGRVLQLRPDARIMPLKVLNPWGVTSSAALLAAFDYALSHGASVILCAWSTAVPSLALKEGIRRAEGAGVPVVTVGEAGIPRYPAAWVSEFSNLHVIRGQPAELTVPAVRGGTRRWNSPDLAAAAGAAHLLPPP